MKEPIRDSGIIYVGFYKQTEQLGKEHKYRVWQAICEYLFYDNDISEELKGTSKIVFDGILPQLNANIKRRDKQISNGKKGAEHGVKGGRPKSKSEVTSQSIANEQSMDGKSIASQAIVNSQSIASDHQDTNDTLKNNSSNINTLAIDKKPPYVNVNENANDNVNDNRYQNENENENQNQNAAHREIIRKCVLKSDSIDTLENFKYDYYLAADLGFGFDLDFIFLGSDFSAEEKYELYKWLVYKQNTEHAYQFIGGIENLKSKLIIAKNNGYDIIQLIDKSILGKWKHCVFDIHLTTAHVRSFGTSTEGKIITIDPLVDRVGYCMQKYDGTDGVEFEHFNNQLTKILRKKELTELIYKIENNSNMDLIIKNRIMEKYNDFLGENWRDKYLDKFVTNDLIDNAISNVVNND